MIRLSDYAPDISRNSEGIWYANKAEPVSYPSEGNDQCFEIEGKSFWFQHRNACIIELVKKFPPLGKGPIFDVGGGNGFVAKGLLEAGWDVVLVEPGPTGARNAKKRGLQNVICATTQSAGFKPGCMPAIGIFDVLEHIKDDAGFLSELHKIIRPGGILYVTVPALSVLWSHEDIHAGHFRRYNPKSLKQLVTGCGFKPIFASYMFSLLPISIFLFRTLPYLLGLRKGGLRWQSIKKDHAEKMGFLGVLISGYLNMELAMIRKGTALKLGGSCLVVARGEKNKV